MADDTDFVVLYDELGLEPGCTMAQFKQAYRRRVGKLHPDSPGHPTDIARLQRLNRLYRAAIDFHRMHDRLPGARRLAAAGMVSAPQQSQAPSPSAEADEPALTGSRGYSRYLMLLGIVVAALLWMQSEQAPEQTQTGAVHDGPAPPAGDKPDTNDERVLAIGMDDAQVLDIQGPPLRSHASRWDYGPSWVGFRCGKVSAWYSSPLRPLRVDGPSPVIGAATGKKTSSDC